MLLILQNGTSNSNGLHYVVLINYRRSESRFQFVRANPTIHAQQSRTRSDRHILMYKHTYVRTYTYIHTYIYPQARVRTYPRTRTHSLTLTPTLSLPLTFSLSISIGRSFPRSLVPYTHCNYGRSHGIIHVIHKSIHQSKAANIYKGISCEISGITL